ncbi:homoserine kinase [Aestuariibacter sp. AA17]|uniref:Homoserine kinase n=1 Tax=Fluctibacter corallii TaxID=2984329 RepID=A0ABT3A4A6_9ALTE|nr:homoserine kinase [Aestuariibacter sp. AA17]MCV2883514.1 homoserine kinase [Aestuariibacter sp. AA17]
MPDSEMLTAYAPASIGNVSLGFDLLGAALAPIDGAVLGDTVTVHPSDSFSLSVEGRFAHKLPGKPAENIVTRCYAFYLKALEAKGKSAKPLSLTLNKHLPVGSGLGSSASSIVAAFHGLNVYHGSPFSDDELLRMMGELEGSISGSVHYDNVAPCFLGGLSLMAESGDRVALPLPTFENWYWVVCYSGISVSTSAARKILPTAFSLADTIQFGRQLAVFIDALHRQDETLAASVMQDVIAEPHRKSLLPMFDESKAFALAQGALAFGISGSGPTVFAVTNELENAKVINSWLEKHYIQNDDGFSHICRINNDGAIANVASANKK